MSASSTQVLVPKTLVVVLLFCFSFLGCGSSSEDRTFGPMSTDESSETADSNAGGSSSNDSDDETVDAEASTQTFFFGEDGNLWKPEADQESSGPGNLVVLFDSRFSIQFDSCEVRKTDGTTAQLLCINDQPFTQIPFSCFSNGNRQTWRATFKCEEALEVLVRCRLGADVYIFTVGEAARPQTCSRFG